MLTNTKFLKTQREENFRQSPSILLYGKEKQKFQAVVFYPALQEREATVKTGTKS